MKYFILFYIKKENPKIKLEVWWQDEMRIGQQGSLSRDWAKISN